jgi:hypothetical protein
MFDPEISLVLGSDFGLSVFTTDYFFGWVILVKLDVWNETIIFLERCSFFVH